MRPIERGSSPIQGDFNKYQDARTPLVDKIGKYCSYCERIIKPIQEVEHIQPKSIYPHLKNQWENFLLACSNCNATKGAKNFPLDTYYLPDRDNTFFPFDYLQDGSIVIRTSLNITQQQMAHTTLELTGLDKTNCVKDRIEVWITAQECLSGLQQQPQNEQLKNQIIRNALSEGSFSIWMAVFENDIKMRRRFIEAFPGTAQDCFDLETKPVSPRPTNVALLHSGKI